MGRLIIDIDIRQEKCLNVEVSDFREKVCNRKICYVSNWGKYLRLHLDSEYNIMLGLGMGADILYYDTEKLPSDNYQCNLMLDKNIGFTCRFWWFGHFHLLSDEELGQTKKYQKIGLLPDHLEFTFNYFYERLYKRKARIKNAILDQRVVSGIGNAYI
ncbi:hypothetical protein CG709_01840, partial [Lachnotalea glycerini]